MNKLFLLKPEVAGEQGSSTVIENLEDWRNGKVPFPNVSYLEYQFFGWLGDELLESFPCFIITENLAQKLLSNNISGVKVSDVTISKSGFYDDLEMKDELPIFFRLEPQGKVSFDTEYKVTSWSGDDLCLGEKSELIVSEKTLGILQKGELANCEIIELNKNIVYETYFDDI